MKIPTKDDRAKKYRLKNKAKIAEYGKKWRIDNKEKVAAYGREWRSLNKERVSIAHKEYRLRTKYGLTIEQHTEMLAHINSTCPICESKLSVGTIGGKTAVVDHDHVTGLVRGILCSNCNTALGFLSSERHLINAIVYLNSL